jgi:hypothetical protein
VGGGRWIEVLGKVIPRPGNEGKAYPCPELAQNLSLTAPALLTWLAGGRGFGQACLLVQTFSAYAFFTRSLLF